MKSQSVKIDQKNPGHFFTCCGILYCADRMFKEAYGHFKEEQFVLSAECYEKPLNGILRNFQQCQSETIIEPDGDNSDAPLCLKSIPTRLDFYSHFDNRPKIKLFAGQEKIMDIIMRWFTYIKKWDGRNIITLQDLEEMNVSSGFDTHTSWNSLDVGFSLNQQKMQRRSYPLVEFFAHVGAQTYSWSKNGNTFQYQMWNTPLPLAVARAVGAGAIKMSNTKCFQFKAEKSGQKQVLNSSYEVSG